MKKHSAEMAASEAELDSEIKQIAGKSAAADKMLAERIKRVAKNKKQIMTTQQQEDHLKKLSLEGETMLHKVRLRARSRKSLISRKKKKEEAKVKETQKELKKLGDKYKRLEAAPKQIRERTLAAQKSATRAQAAAAAMNIQLKDVGGKKTQLVGKM